MNKYLKNGIISLIIVALITLAEYISIQLMGKPILALTVPGGDIVSYYGIGINLDIIMAVTINQDYVPINQITLNPISFIVLTVIIFVIISLFSFLKEKSLANKKASK
jgi:hypothetical protein